MHFVYGTTKCVWKCSLQVAMRALGFEAKKADVLKILKDCDHQSTGKIVFSDFQDVSKCQSCVLFTCMHGLVCCCILFIHLC